MVWMFVCPQNSYVEILILKVMLFGGGAFGRWLGHESGVLRNPTEQAHSCCNESLQPEDCCLGSGLSPHTETVGTLILDFPELWEVNVKP